MPESRLTFTLHNLVAVLDRHADGILRRERDMTYSQFLFLVHLADGPRDGTQLASSLQVSRAAVSKRLDWFTEKGWVTVKPDPNHGRRQVIALTPAGAHAVRDAGDLLERAFQLPAQSETGVDLDALHADLKTLLDLFTSPPKPASAQATQPAAQSPTAPAANATGQDPKGAR